MKEKDFQVIFRDNNIVHGVFELKLVKGFDTPFAFNAVRPNQIKALTDISTDTGYFHKLHDMPVSQLKHTRMRFTQPKPFDCFYLQGVDAYVVVGFYEPRKPLEVFYIEIENLKDLPEKVGKKSIRMSELMEVEGEYCYHCQMKRRGK